MKVVQVNKTSNPVQLKLLYPNIKLAVNNIPAYGTVLYRDFEYPVSDKTELILEQSSSGYNLDTALGLIGFLRDVGYMSGAKIDRLEALSMEKKMDLSGKVIRPDGIFAVNPDVVSMYIYCSTLKVSNKSFLEDVVDAGYVLDILEAPLYKRLSEADQLGYEKMFRRILQLMDSFYSKDMKFTARRNSKGVSGFDRMSRLMNTFNVMDFKGFTLSGDLKEDCYILLSLFS